MTLFFAIQMLTPAGWRTSQGAGSDLARAIRQALALTDRKEFGKYRAKKGELRIMQVPRPQPIGDLQADASALFAAIETPAASVAWSY